MAIRSVADLRLLFERGDKPTQQDFVDLIDSFLHAQAGNFPNPLPAVSGKYLKDIGDALPNPLPARDGSLLTGISPSEYNVITGNPTPSYATATSFVLTGDFSAQLPEDTRLELTIAAAPFYTNVVSAPFSAGSTTVTIVDSMPGTALTAFKKAVIRPAAAGGAVNAKSLGAGVVGEGVLLASSAQSARSVLGANASGDRIFTKGSEFNLSFEDDFTNWTVTPFAGGSVTVDSAFSMHGLKSAKLTSTVNTNGAGSVLSDYMPCSSDGSTVGFAIQATSNPTGIGNLLHLKVVVKCYNRGLSFLGDVVFFDAIVGGSGDPQKRMGVSGTLVSGTAYARVEITHRDTIFAAVGDVWIDDVSLSQLTDLGGHAIASQAIGQGKLKTAIQQIVIASGASGGNVVATGGEYTLGSAMNDDGLNVDTATIHVGAAAEDLVQFTNTSYVNFRMVSPATAGSNKNARFRYVQASPPYDLGDGEVPLFVFLLLGAGGQIQMASVSEDPPWAYNGPTDVRSQSYRNGTGFRSEPALIAEFGSVRKALRAGLTPDAVAKRLRRDPMVEMAVTTQFKNSDMALVPHPFLALSAAVPVLLDPVSPLCMQLADFHRVGEFAALIEGGHLKVSNAALRRAGPPGVQIVAGRF